jgi:hypothetical protein
LKDEHGTFRFFYINVVIGAISAAITAAISSAKKIFSCKYSEPFFIRV